MTTVDDIKDHLPFILNDEVVARYIGCTAEQVRIMRQTRFICSGCYQVHESFPTIKAFHSLCCKTQRRCACCDAPMPELLCGHEVGLICATCYGPEDPI